MNRIRPSRPSRPVTLPHLSAAEAAGVARSARLRGRAALVGLAAALTVSGTACEFGSRSEQAVAVEASEPESPSPADAPTPTETPAADVPMSDAAESDAAVDGLPESDAPVSAGTPEPAAIDGREHDGGADDRDHATRQLPVVPRTEVAEPAVVVVQPEPAAPQPTVRPEPRPAAPVTPITSAPVATVPPTIVPLTTEPPTTMPPTTQPPATEPPVTQSPTTMPPTTQPPTTMPPTTQPPTTMPPTTMPPTTQPPTTVPPTTQPTPSRYLVEVGTVGVRAGDCTRNPSDTATFIEGSGGAYGAPQFPIGTYVSTSSPTQIGEPSYTFVDAPGTRAVWGQITWKFTGITGDNVLTFNVRNVGTTTIRDHRTVSRLDGGTCSPLFIYTITVTPTFD